MTEADRGLPSEYEWKYDLSSGLEVLCPTGWFYHSEQDEKVNKICCTQEYHEHENVEVFNTGLLITVHPGKVFVKSHSERTYRKMTGKLPKLFQDMDPVGPLSDIEQEGSIISRYQDFEAGEDIYVIEQKSGIEDSFKMQERLFKVRLMADIQKGRVYIARFVMPAEEPEKMEIAATMLKSITIR